MEQKKIIIAVDGYSSTGKSTMAKKLARQVGYRYIDSGAMYRAVALFATEWPTRRATWMPENSLQRCLT